MNYFELFGLPTQFQVDGGLLSSQFRELQKRFHPDNFASASERDRLMSVQKASEVNDAYQVLKAPLSRAEYILFLNGIDLRNEQHTMNDPEFLMTQMELREQLEEIEESKDADDALAAFDSKVSKSYKTLLIQLESELNESLWEDAASTVRKLKFISKLQKEIERVEDSLLG